MPQVGDKLRIWPSPGRRVQDGSRPADALGGGRFLPLDGADVVWTEFHHAQMGYGDIMLHDPKPAPTKKEKV